MYQKFLRTGCAKRKQVLPTTLVLKYGKAKNTAESAIFGQLGAYFTKCALYILHSELKIFLVYIEKLLLEIMTQFLLITLKSFEI